jgi:uncharacterized protein YozE (UPF0346 family)
MNETMPSLDSMHVGYIAPPMERSEIKEVVDVIKGFWTSITNNEVEFDILVFLDLVFPEVEENFRLLAKSFEDMGDYLGLTVPQKNEIYIRDDIYQNAMKGSIEAKKVFAHELGHYLLHSSIKYPKLANSETPATCLAEEQADIFADELLSVEVMQLELFKNI